MLKLSLKPGEYITLGDNIKIIFSGGSANNIHLLVDAPREINVARNSAGKDKKPSPYHITFRRNGFRGTHTWRENFMRMVVQHNMQAANANRMLGVQQAHSPKEMVNYSKNNILAQAGQSMFAQANQSNQGVLSLLQ